MHKYSVSIVLIDSSTTNCNASLNCTACELPLYLDRQSNSCVRQCPLFTFGNHTTEQCQPCKLYIKLAKTETIKNHYHCAVPDVIENGVQADATVYFGSVPTNATFGTEVFRFRIVIDLIRFDDDLDAIVTIMVRNNLVESIFKFSDGQNTKTFAIAAQGGIDAVNASRVFPEIRLVENRLVVFEDSVIYQQAPPLDLQLPTTLDFDLILIVVGRGSTNIQELLPFAVGTVVLTLPPGTYSCL